MLTTVALPSPLIPFDPAPFLVPGGDVHVSGILCADINYTARGAELTGHQGMLHGDLREALFCHYMGTRDSTFVRARVFVGSFSGWGWDADSLDELSDQWTDVTAQMRAAKMPRTDRASLLRASLAAAPTPGVRISVFAPTPAQKAEREALQKGPLSIASADRMLAIRESATREFHLRDLAQEIARLRIASPVRKQPKSAARQVA